MFQVKEFIHTYQYQKKESHKKKEKKKKKKERKKRIQLRYLTIKLTQPKNLFSTAYKFFFGLLIRFNRLMVVKFSKYLM